MFIFYPGLILHDKVSSFSRHWGKNLFLRLFLHLVTSCLWAPPLSSKYMTPVSSFIITMPYPLNLIPPIYFLYVWLEFHWAYMDNPEYSPYFQLLNLITYAKFLLQSKVNIHKLWGFKCGYIWRAIIQPVT